MTAPALERERVLELIYRHGYNATAFQTLETGYRYFFHGTDACVAYVDTGAAWVVAGAPIASTSELASVTHAFLRRARDAGKRACFFATEERLQRALDGGIRSLQIGEQAVYDPNRWTETLSERRSLREQLRRARAKGVRVRALEPAELDAPATRDAMNHLTRRWSASHGLPALDFLVRVEPFFFPAHRRCFVAEREGRLLGFAGVVPVPARRGFLLEDLIREPSAPNGTAELLVDGVMRFAAATGSEFLTLGLAPLAGNVPRALRLAKKSGSFLYDFDGIRAFRHKLAPDSWSSIYLSHPTSQGAVPSLFDALSAFAGGSLLRFGVRSLLRRLDGRSTSSSHAHRADRIDARGLERRQQSAEHADQRPGEQRQAEERRARHETEEQLLPRGLVLS